MLLGVVTAGFLAFYYLASFGTSVWAYPFTSFGAAAAVFAGIALHRPARWFPWAMFGTGLLLAFAGDLQYSYDYMVTGIEEWPTIGDAAYLAGFVLLIASVVLFLRQFTQGNDRGILVDALIVALGAGILAWTLFMAPWVYDEEMTVFERLASIAYPLADLVLLLLIVRLSFDGRRVSRSMLFLSIGSLLYLMADAWYFYLELADTYYDQHPVDAGWILGFAFFGLAALHPTMAQERTVPAFARPGLTQRRLVMLAVGTLLAPATLMIDWLYDDDTNIPVVAVGSAVLFLLVLIRLGTYVSEHRRAEERERALRLVDGELRAASTTDEALRIARCGAHDLIGDGRSLVRLLTGTADRLTELDASAPPLELGAFAPEVGAALGREESVTLSPDVATRLGAWFNTRSPTSGGALVPIRREQELTGVFVALGNPLPLHVVNGLESIAAQLSLAIEHISLRDDLMRRRSEARFRALVQNAADVILIVDADGVVRYASPAIAQLAGVDPVALEGEAVTGLIHEEDYPALQRALRPGAAPVLGPGTLTIRVRSGVDWRVCETKVNDLTADDEIEGVVLTLHDVTEERQLGDQLYYRAFHDPLTGLPNRALFMDRLEHGIARSNRDADSLAVLFIDVDDFKLVNDSMGHAAGDVLLQTIASRLSATTRPGDTVSRFAGDEFTVLLEHATVADASAYAERLQAVMAQPIHAGGRELVVTLSIGFAVKTDPTITADDLLKQADVAMYVAKTSGKSNWAAFDPAMTDAVWRRIEIESELRRAIDADEFEIHYQPIVHIERRDVVEVEALVRWRHPSRGLLTPSDFLAVAEKTRLMLQIDWWVLEEACSTVAAWRGGGDSARQIAVSVNVSPGMLRHPRLPERVSEILSSADLEASALKLEISEASIAHDRDVIAHNLRRLKELGVQIAVDDAGTSYATLAGLSRLPVDVVKIDRSLVRDLDRAGGADAVVQSMVQLARALRLGVTTEGVETLSQLKLVRAAGSDQAQGHLFAEPLPAADIVPLFSRYAMVANAAD